MSPAPGGSTLMTSAPKSASMVEQNGPASAWLRSSTLTPSSGIAMRGLSTKFLLFTFLFLVQGAALSQAYPAKPVKIIVPAQPGGGLDLIGRTVADQLSRSMGQSFVVENIGGGGGVIACQTVARSAPDGYTLMVGYV